MNNHIPATVARTDKIAENLVRISRIAHAVAHLNPAAAEQMYIAVESIHESVVDIMEFWHAQLTVCQGIDPDKLSDIADALASTIAQVKAQSLET